MKTIRKIILPILALFLTTIFTNCAKETVSSEDTTVLCDALFEENQDVITTEMNDLMSDLAPNSTNEDPLGHETNLTTLIERLNDKECIFNASINCYACIETMPLQSEIIIQILIGGDVTQEYIMDILMHEDAPMEYGGVHE